MAAPTSATHPIPSPGGGAPRSESLIYMIAGGNHTLIHRCRAQARRMRNAGGNLMKGKPYQASSHIQYFAVPLPSFSSLLRRYEKSTLPPGEGIGPMWSSAPTKKTDTPRRGGHWPSVTPVRYPTGGRAMLAPTSATHLWNRCRAGPWSRRKRPPLTRGLSPPKGGDWGRDEADTFSLPPALRATSLIRGRLSGGR